ncbi:MAG: hypothetical protein HYU35_00590 [Parcubacteria group bacterium]|nr:hypothetical protein [Parcubacteria group bacterium]
MRNIIIGAVFVLIAIGVFLTWIRPQLDAAAVLRREQTSLGETLSRFRELRTVRDGLLSRYNTILQRDLDRLNVMVPPTPETGALITELDQLAQSHALLLKSVDIGEQPEQPGAAFTRARGMGKRLTLNIDLVGSYPAFRSFLQDLERSLRLIDIDILSFSVGDKDVNQYALRASSYWLGSK